MRRVARGFTLIELAVTMTLFALLIAAGLPSFMAWIGNSKVRTVAQSLQDGVRRAQSEAVRLNQAVVLSLTNSTPALNAPAAANGQNWSIQSIAQFEDHPATFIAGGALADLASNVSINSNGITALCFNSNGRLMTGTPASTGVTNATCSVGTQQFDLTQSSADRPLRVLIAIGGQIRLCDPNRPTLSSTSPDGCPLP